VNQEPEPSCRPAAQRRSPRVCDVGFARFTRLRATESLGESLNVPLPPISMLMSSCFIGSPSSPAIGLESDQAMVALLGRARVDIDELCLGFAELFDPRA